MRIGRAALPLAATSAFFSCTAISGLGGLTFDGGGGGAGFGATTGSGGAASSSRGVGAGPAVGGGGQGQGGQGGQGVGGVGGVGGTGAGTASSGPSTSSAVSSVSSTIAVSSAVSSTTGGGPCIGPDPGVCCPNTTCNANCCHNNQMDTCQVVSCSMQRQVVCDDSRDCSGGQVCCAYYNGNDYTQGIRCALSCVHPNSPGNPGNYEICSLAQPNCVTGGACHPSNVLQGDAGYCF